MQRGLAAHAVGSSPYDALPASKSCACLLPSLLNGMCHDAALCVQVNSMEDSRLLRRMIDQHFQGGPAGCLPNALAAVAAAAPACRRHRRGGLRAAAPANLRAQPAVQGRVRS